jgi:hypothetical protein
MVSAGLKAGATCSPSAWLKAGATRSPSAGLKAGATYSPSAGLKPAGGHLMSSSERHRRSRRFRTLCAACRERKARFRYRGEVRADRDHTLCFECYRAEINGARARRFRERATPPVMRSPSSAQELASSPVLDARRIAHRQRMLEHLQRASGVAS